MISTQAGDDHSGQSMSGKAFDGASGAEHSSVDGGHRRPPFVSSHNVVTKGHNEQ
jgi:hypothetical protein